MKLKAALIYITIFMIMVQNVKAQDYTSTKIFGDQQIAIRDFRKNAISGNIGWNGLTGFGVTYHSYIKTQLAIEAGLGLSSTGVKFGTRLSYLFSKKNFSPLVSGGFMYGMGVNSPIDYDLNGEQFSVLIKASPFAQISGGFEYISNGGFIISSNIGYAILLGQTNYTIYGNPGSENRRALEAAFGSGIVIEMSIGYAFGN